VKVHAVDVLAGNIHSARVHYRIMPEQHFDQAFKVGWLKESAL